MSKAAPRRSSLVASKKPLVKCSCDTFSFFVLIYWFKLERLKREPTKRWRTRNTIVLYLYIYSFLVRATFGQLSLFSFPNIIFKFKHKAKKGIITSITTTPWGVAKDILRDGFGQPLFSN